MDLDLLSSGLPIIISVVLFLVTLAIMFILRAEDKKDRRLEMIKRRINQCQAEMSQAGDQLQQRSAEAEERMSQKEREARQLLTLVDEQLADIKAHSDDLAELQRVLDYYHQMLGQLAQMTERAELRTTQVKDEVRKVEQVQTVIDAFLAQVDDANSSMTAHRQALSAMQRESVEELQGLQNDLASLDQRALADIQKHQEDLHAIERAAVAAANHEADVFMSRCREQMDQLFDTGLRRTDAAFQTMIHTVQEFLRELESRLEATHQASQALLDSSATSLSGVLADVQGHLERIQAAEETLQRLEDRQAQAKEAVERLDIERQELAAQIEAAGVALIAANNDAQRVLDERLAAEAEARKAREEAEQAEESVRLAELRRSEASFAIDEAEKRTQEQLAEQDRLAQEIREQERLLEERKAECDRLAEQADALRTIPEDSDAEATVSDNDDAGPASDEPAVDDEPETDGEPGQELELGSFSDASDEDAPEDSPFVDLDDEDVDLSEDLEDLEDAGLDILADSGVVEDDEPQELVDDFSSQVEDLLGMDDLEVEDADGSPENLDPALSDENVEDRRKHVEFVPVGEEEEISLDDDL